MNNEIIDFHTHAFPDELAPRAMKKLLEEAPGVEAFLDGKISSLIESMDRNGISKSVICCIATTPEQFEPILKWCKKVRNCQCSRSNEKNLEVEESIKTDKTDFSTRLRLARNDVSDKDGDRSEAKRREAEESIKIDPSTPLNQKRFRVARDDIVGERLIMFPSIHPADEKYKERIAAIKAEGFKGVKMHPYYQDFRLDEDRMLPIYEELIRNDLMIVIHTGYDIAFPNDDRADSHKILKVTEMFPSLKFVATHLGAWQQWDEVEKVLAGKHIYMETSWSLECISPEQARRIILKHPADCVLFGTDSPWTEQGKSIELLKGLNLPEELERRILYENAKSLLWPQQKP